MRRGATLIYNGDPEDGDPSSDTLCAALEAAGYQATTATKDALDEALERAEADANEHVVVVAGGDGTVGTVTSRLRGRGLPFAILPLGTANNVARTLGLSGDTATLVAGLATPHKQSFDLGLARGPWGECAFTEAVGGGLFAHTLAERASEEDKAPGRALRRLLETLSGYHARPWTVTLDGEDLSGDFLLVAAMNIRAVGPNLDLAPDAEVSDGLFDLVLIGEDEREALGAYLNARLQGERPHPGFTVRRGKRVTLAAAGEPVHVDDETETPTQALELSVDAQALELWLPGGAS